MPDAVVIEVKDFNQHVGESYKVLGLITRIPRQHKGWQSVKYNNQRFQLLGGIRNPLFINMRHPLSKKTTSKENVKNES